MPRLRTGPDTPARAPGRTLRLDPDSIVTAALALIARDGVDGLSMRRLGAELGADPTAVYRHFRSKEALLSAMAERIFEGALDGFDPGRPWRTVLLDLIAIGRRIYTLHPGFATVLARHPEDAPSLTAIAEHTLGALAAAGLDDHDAAWLYHAIVNVVVGTALIDAVAPVYADDGARQAIQRAFAALPPATHPACVRAAASMAPPGDVVFDLTVELLLDSIEARGQRREGAVAGAARQR